MAKLTGENREEFKRESDAYEAVIKKSLDKEKNILSSIKSNPTGNEYKKIELCNEMIYVATLYNGINSSSIKILDVKNNDALNEARKILYKAIIYLEEIVTNVINIAPSELVDNMAAIQNTSVQERFLLVKKLGLAIQMVVDAFGENSKWKWSFVELEGRYAVVAKNLLDLKAAAKEFFDPNAPNYETVILYIRLIKELLEKSANSYRDKYELSSRRIDDMQSGINFLLALRRVSTALGESEEAEELKKKAQTWKEKMVADQKSGKAN